MDFLQTKEYYTRQVETTIDELKAENCILDATISIRTLAEASDKQDREYQEVYSWLLNALNGDTVQREVSDLTTSQTRYASYLIQAVHDCVTMVL